MASVFLSLVQLASILSIFLVCPLDAGKTTKLFSSFEQPAWDESLDLKAIEVRLKTESIAQIHRINKVLAHEGKSTQGDSAMRLVILESGLKAVFKPGEYRYGEVAAYKANQALGQRLVPPTVLRTIDGMEGSLQFFVESPLDLKKMTNADGIFKKLDPKDLSDMKLFYFVFGQWDTHHGNQIVAFHKGKPFLALIDNAGILHRSFTRYGHYTFIEKGKNAKISTECTELFPYDDAKTIRPGSLEALRRVFGPYVSEKALRKLWSLRKPITYCLWDGTLWMLMYNRGAIIKPSATKRYYASTLKAYEKLDRATLQNVWAEWLSVEKEHAESLICLTLKRRDEMLEAAYLHGHIIADVP